MVSSIRHHLTLVEALCERICQTPGANYEITINDKTIGATVKLPKEISTPDMSEKDAQKIEDKLHDALEKIVAKMFADLDPKAKEHWQDARDHDPYDKTSLHEAWPELPQGRRNWYHVSDHPDLSLSADYEPSQGQLGKGFYVTAGDPQVWRDSLGKRQFTYKVINADAFRIATKSPSMQQVNEWAIANGYMAIGPVIKPSGEVVNGDDGKPLQRPEVTAKGKALLWKDPMTGGGIKGLENAFLQAQGFDGYEAQYSRDGHQIIIFDPAKVKLKRLAR